MKFPEKQLQRTLALDTETFLIETGEIAPKLVCTSFAWRDPSRPDEVQQLLLGNHPTEAERTKQILSAALSDPECLIVGQFIAYDAAVLMRAFPDMIPLWFRAYADLRIYCTAQAEKLRSVSRHGEIEFIERPDGSRTPAKYHLDSLIGKYLGKNRTGDKMDPTSWRLNYNRLDGMLATEYPLEARRYALEDAYDTLLVAEAQQAEGLRDPEYDSIATVRLRTWTDFSYFLCTVRGMVTDQATLTALQAEAEEIAHWSKLTRMVEAGFLVPPEPSRPYANGAVNKDTGEPLMVAEKPEKLKQSLFRLYFLRQALAHGAPITLTDGKGYELFRKDELETEEVLAYLRHQVTIPEKQAALQTFLYGIKNPVKDKEQLKALEPWGEAGLDPAVAWQIASVVSIAADEAQKLAVITKDPMLAEYQKRASVAKLRTTVFPHVVGQPLVHATFDFPKKTMRAGGRLSDKYASFPAHQMPQELGGIDPRQGFVARPGYLLVDADYQSLELCTVGQTTWDLFKSTGIRCVHREKINAGYDLHAYLAAQLGASASPELQSWFHEQRAGNEDERYRAFKMLAEQGEDAEAIYKHWRKLAKPVGLGYPGRLGPKTMVAFAAGTYGVLLTLDQAGQFRDLWHSTYVEMRPFFDWAKGQRDIKRPVLGEDRDGRQIEGYYYKTPFGTVRRGCMLTDLCNGVSMQSPAAEGFNLALCLLQRACYDPSLGNVLLGSGVVVPFHDQVVVEVPAHTLDHARACAAEIERILVFAMRQVCPDVTIRAEPALCTAWSKSAKRLLDSNGLLIPWSPSTTKTTKAA